jgi:hydrogenase assembly chaperone HypC/HupF
VISSQPNLRPEAGEHCDPETGCITCGDVAVPLRVVALDAGRALALCSDGDGRRETVEIALVAPVAIGDELLVHAGTAITRLEAHEIAASPAAPGRGSSMEMPEAEAEGKGFWAGAEEAAGIYSEEPAGQ